MIRNSAESRLPASQTSGQFLAPDLSPVDPGIVGGTGWLIQTARPKYSESKVKKALRGLSLGAFLAPGMINDLQTMTHQVLIDSGHHQTAISSADHQTVLLSPHQSDIQTIEAAGKQVVFNLSQDLAVYAANGAIGLYERFFDDKLGYMHPRLVKAGLSVMGFERGRETTATDLGKLAAKRLQKQGATPKEIALGVLASAVGIYPDRETKDKWWIVEYKDKKGGGKVASIRVKPDDQNMLSAVKTQLIKNIRSFQSGDGWGAAAGSNESAPSYSSSSEEITQETIIRAWTPEEKAMATAQALDQLQTQIPENQKQNYELVLLTVAVPLTADSVTLAPGAIPLIDASGYIWGFAVNAADAGILLLGAPGLILGGVQDTVESRSQEEYAERMKARLEGWRNVLNWTNDGSSVIKDAKGNTVAQINQNTDDNSKPFNSDEGGQVANPNPDQFKPRELSPEQQKIDEIIENERVREELHDTFIKGYDARTSSRDKVINDPPPFRHVKEFNVAVYDPKTGQVFEGTWSDFHNWVAKANGIRFDQYISASVFRLKGAGGIKILNIDSTNGLPLTVNDIVTMQNAGYQVMGPGFKWIVLDPSSPEGYIQIPSTFYP